MILYCIMRAQRVNIYKIYKKRTAVQLSTRYFDDLFYNTGLKGLNHVARYTTVD